MTALDNAPSHWKRTTIGEIADVRLGRQRSPKNHSGDQMRPYLRAANVDWYRLRPEDVKEMNFTDAEMETYALKEDDILVVEGSGSASEVGKCALVPTRFAGHGFQNTLIRVRAKDGIDPRWLMHFINAEAGLGGFLQLARGSGIFHLGSRRTGRWPVAVPPLEEQRQIVAELERLLSHLDSGRQGLVSSNRRLPGVMASAIEAAMRGGPAERGGEAREELSTACATLDPNPTKVDPQPVPAWLPDGWAWVELRRAVGDDGVVSDGDWVETKDQDPEGSIRLLQLSDIGRGQFRDRSDRFINDEAAARLGVTYVQPGDVLISRLGDPPGDATLVPDLGQRLITAVDVCIVRPAPGSVSAKWLMWCLNSPGFRARVIEYQSGTTRKRISRSKLEQLCVPVPPRPVQDQLCDWLLARARALDRMSAALSAADQRAASLRRSILKAAFEGRLTSKDVREATSSDDIEEALAS